MPRNKSGTFDQSKYVQQYIHDNIKHIKVSLNKNKPDDMQMIAWIAQQPEGASGYIKRLIREDMSQERNIVKWLYELAMNTLDKPITPSEIIKRIEEGGFHRFVIERKP